jgi:putative endonuclease
MRTAQQRAGDAAETLVAERLTDAGWQILARNHRVGRTELDIVAVDPGPPPALVIVEVRWRRRRDYGLPEETVDWQKLRRLWAAGLALAQRGLPAWGRPLPAAVRLDVVAVEPGKDATGQPTVRHHRNALRD